MRKYTPPHLEVDTEIDLAPMLALMVTLIPILLLSSVFVHIRVISTTLPQAVSEAIESNKKNSTSIKITQNSDFSFTIYTSDNASIRVPSQSGHYNYLILANELEKIKIQNPSVFRAELLPDAGVEFQKITRTMDTLRKSKNTDFRFTDLKTSKQVVTKLMYPDIVFSKISGGL